MSSNLPPGVTDGMIESFFADPPPPPKCQHCGSFLRLKPDSSSHVEDALTCSGDAEMVDVLYEPYEVDLLGLVPGATYAVGYAECGREGSHDPHREVLYDTLIQTRICPRCRFENVETS